MIGTDVERAARVLREGGLVGMPTETVYGLAANALDPVAVTRVFEVKRRPSFDPLIVHVADLERARLLSAKWPRSFDELAAKMWPGPLTFLVERGEGVSDMVTAGSHRVALRCPSHPLAQELLQRAGLPLVAPSANPFGYVSPTTAAHVEEQLGEHISYVLDGGPCAVGVESTIVGMEEGVLTVFRKGGLAIEAIEEAIGTAVAVRAHSSSNPEAPGMLKSHYAPGVAVELVSDWAVLREQKLDNAGILSFGNASGLAAAKEIVVGRGSDLGLAARELFSALRQLDDAALERIYAQLVPEEGLGRAINDRLRRAAAS